MSKLIKVIQYHACVPRVQVAVQLSWPLSMRRCSLYSNSPTKPTIYVHSHTHTHTYTHVANMFTKSLRSARNLWSSLDCSRLVFLVSARWVSCSQFSTISVCFSSIRSWLVGCSSISRSASFSRSYRRSKENVMANYRINQGEILQ